MIYKDSKKECIIQKGKLVSKNIRKKKNLYKNNFQIKTIYILRIIIFCIKIFYFFILFIYSNIYKTKLFNINKEKYYSHTK